MAERPDTPDRGSAPAWLSRLRSGVDRRLALRLLASPGESCLRRILQAMNDGASGRTRGRPEAPMPPGWLDRAAFLYVTRDGVTPGEAAGLAANELVLSGGILGEERNGARRKISDALRPHADALGSATFGGLTATHLWKVAVRVHDSGQRIREDLFPTIAASGEQERRLRALRKNIMPPSHPLPRSLVDFESKIAPAVLDTATLRFFSFLRAFEDVLPPDAPASVARAMFREVHRFISDEAAIRVAQSGEQDPSAETP